MSSDWMDELMSDSPRDSNDSDGTFYCPYTNAAECALLTMGWQPQELCRDLDCDQLRFFGGGARRQDEAA